VAVTASSGDGSYGVEYPAASRYVTAVGGTSLSKASNSRGWSETVWSGAGSGCSAYDAKPAWQTDTGCAKRTVADVAAVADPNTGVAVYDTYAQGSGWMVFGGTSVASPLIASVYALAGTPSSGSVPASFPYAHTSALYDVTSGSNGSCSPSYLCTGTSGYDGPTGLGTPDGVSAFAG
jgi:subtilase family serine protease